MHGVYDIYILLDAPVTIPSFPDNMRLAILKFEPERLSQVLGVSGYSV